MSEPKIDYYPDPIAAFADGCLMDIRIRVALQFTQSMLSSGRGSEYLPEALAKTALDVADELFSQGKARGWIEPLPESGEINAATKRHLERNVNSQLHQQKYAQAINSSTIRPVMNG